MFSAFLGNITNSINYPSLWRTGRRSRTMIKTSGRSGHHRQPVAGPARDPADGQQRQLSPAGAPRGGPGVVPGRRSRRPTPLLRRPRCRTSPRPSLDLRPEHRSLARPPGHRAAARPGRRGGTGWPPWSRCCGSGPSIALIAVVVLWPIVTMVQTSFQNITPLGITIGSAGLSNFSQVFKNPNLPGILVRTVIWVAATVAITMADIAGPRPASTTSASPAGASPGGRSSRRGRPR